jgi:hypothetical protein
MLLARSTDPTGRTPCEIRNKKKRYKKSGESKMYGTFIFKKMCMNNF